jgi:hypothetical protein
MSYYYAMDTGGKFFTRIGDFAYASQCNNTKTAVRNTLDHHWTGVFMTEASNR